MKFSVSRACFGAQGKDCLLECGGQGVLSLGKRTARETTHQEERMGGASWALNVCTSQGTRAKTRQGQRVYLRKLKM